MLFDCCCHTTLWHLSRFSDRLLCHKYTFQTHRIQRAQTSDPNRVSMFMFYYLLSPFCFYFYFYFWNTQFGSKFSRKFLSLIRFIRSLIIRTCQIQMQMPQMFWNLSLITIFFCELKIIFNSQHLNTNWNNVHNKQDKSNRMLPVSGAIFKFRIIEFQVIKWMHRTPNNNKNDWASGHTVERNCRP